MAALSSTLSSTFLPPDMGETVRRALAEDIGTGDVTTLFTVPEETQAVARMVAKAPGVVAGLPVAVSALLHIDPALDVEQLVE